MRLLKLTTTLCLGITVSFAQNLKNNPLSNHGNKFEQLGTILPTPNDQDRKSVV